VLRLSKKSRLIVYLSLLLVAGFSLTSILSYQVSRSAIHDGIMRNQLPLVGDNVYSEIQRDLLRPVFISSVMAQDTFLRDWVLEGEQGEAQIRRYLKEIQDRYQTVTSFFVSDKSKTYYHFSGILKTVSSEAERDAWYFAVKAMDGDYKIDVDFDAANSDTVTIFVNYKMRDYDGNFIGVTGVGLTVEAVGELIERYQDRFQRRIYFADMSGNIVLPAPTDKGADRDIREIPGMKPHVDQILSNKINSIQYESDGDTIFVSTRFIPELNWVLVVQQSDSAAIGNLRNTLFVNLAISLFVTLVVLALTLYAINTFSDALVKAAKTEKDANSRLTRINSQKDKLLSIIGHDLRAPFTAFLGLAEILGSKAKDMKPADVSVYANDVLKSGRTAYGLLESLLNWANVQWEDLKPQPEQIDIADIVHLNVALFASIAERKEIQLEWHGCPAVWITADSNMSNLIVRNLINNAIKFTEQGGSISIDISKADGMAWVTVKDTGIGIDSEHLASLLRSEHKLSMAGTDGEMGIGMGLSLCQEMVIVNGGELEAKSALGEGSEFKFSLPLAEVQST